MQQTVGRSNHKLKLYFGVINLQKNFHETNESLQELSWAKILNRPTDMQALKQFFVGNKLRDHLIEVTYRIGKCRVRSTKS